MEPRDRIDALIDRIAEAEASLRNERRKRKQSPFVEAWLEGPAGGMRLLGFDVHRYFSDPLYYFEYALMEKLWIFENYEDDKPITLDFSLWLGHYPDYTIMGMDVTWQDNGLVHIQTDHPMTRTPNLSLLKPFDFYKSGVMPQALAWHELFETISRGRLKINFINWGRACLDLAVQLRGYDHLIEDSYERPEFLHDLLKYLTNERCRWYADYYRHFGLKPEPTGIADDWINVPFITPSFYQEFLLPRYLELEAFYGGLTGIHSCGNQGPIQKYMLRIKSLDSYEVSPWTSLTETVANLPTDKFLRISMHPQDVLLDTPQKLEEKMLFIREHCVGRRYSVGTSGIEPVQGQSPQQFKDRVRLWTDIGHKVFG